MSFEPLRVTPLPQGQVPSYFNRSSSRASQRSISRLSQRTRTKQPGLLAALNTLVKRVTGLDPERDAEDIQEAMDLALKRIDQIKQSAVPGSSQIDLHFRGHVQRARISIQDALADAMQAKYMELKFNKSQRTDLDMSIKSSTLPAHLQFLLLLSSPPTTATFSKAEMMRAKEDPLQSPQLTWRKIFDEEPLEGQHWQGAYGLPEGSTLEHWNEESSDSTTSMLEVPEYDDSSASSFEAERLPPRGLVAQEQYWSTDKHANGREVVEALEKQQYWRSEWRIDANLRRPFNMGDASTLRPVFGCLTDSVASFASPGQDTFINEVDVVREVLMMLQGRRSCLFEMRQDDVMLLHYHHIVHYTHSAQASILTCLASHGSTLSPLRALVRTLHGKTAFSFPRTFAAFSSAIEGQLRAFDVWCAKQEERICLAQRGGCSSNHVVSLLSLEKEVDVKLAGTFKVLLDITRSTESKHTRLSAPALSTLVLNSLLDAVRTCFAVGDTSTASSLMDVFRESAEPLWSNIGRWLKDGIPLRAGFEGEIYESEPTWDAKEFFIRTNPLVGLDSLDFWEGGYTLLPRHSGSIPDEVGSHDVEYESGIPAFLEHIAEDILAAGKAIGLLRALDMIHLVGDNWLKEWTKFKIFTGALSLRGLDDVLENLTCDVLLPLCRLAQSSLRQVLVEGCDLWRHVRGVENVYLMARGDAMSQFGEKMFARMDIRHGQPWNDFHFLNTAFRDVTKLGAETWINASLVRISHRGNKDRKISRTVRAIDGLAIEYAVPFPLIYMFGPEINANYSSLFTFLLQIRRSKSVLDRILIRGLNGGVLDYATPDLKTFYALRSKLSWFTNTLMTFLMTNVIHASLLEFHAALGTADSLDEMILVHRSHLERLLGRCLLQPNTSALHRAILSILDLSLHFSDCLSAFAGGTSLDVSRHSLMAMRRRRSRARKPNVIGFVEALPLSEDDLDSDGDDEVAEPFAGDVSISFAEEGFFVRLDRMDSELDGLVRFVRRGVESLAGSGGEAAATFGVLAFSLEDWDL